MYYLVVNCLQNLLSLRSETTFFPWQLKFKQLWIAYKIYYLCDRKQLVRANAAIKLCCELLTKFIIFAIGNNIINRFRKLLCVVNCLQNLLSLRSETTKFICLSQKTELWIAYKIYYLCDRKQPGGNFAPTNPRCELLTKFIIFAIGNNC